MTYSIAVRGPTKQAALTALVAELDKLMVREPLHAEDCAARAPSASRSGGGRAWT